MQKLRRLVRHEPGYVALTLLTLGLGLGAVIAIYGLVDGVLFKSLPFPDSARVIAFDHEAPKLDLDSMGISRKLYLHYRREAKQLAEIGLADDPAFTLTGDGAAERVPGSQATPSLFRVLVVGPAVGRLFAEEEGAPGGSAVALISWQLWQQRYAGARDVLGKPVTVDGVEREIVGVMPRRFAFPEPDTQVWVPRVIDPETAQLGAFSDFAVARLAPGATLESLRAELQRLTTGLAQWFPDERAAPVLENAGFRAKVQPLLESQVGSLRQVLFLLLASVGVILLIACANGANLLLVRVEERGHELGLRSALGATRSRMVRGLLGESILLAGLAGVLGVGLAAATLGLIRAFGPADVPRLESVGLDGRVLGFAALLTLAAGIGFGVLPAVRGTTERLLVGVRQAARSGTASRSRQRTRAALVVTQVALGLELLVGAGLLVRSLLALRDVHPGFDARSALAFSTYLPEGEYPNGESRVRLSEQATLRVSALPGVERVGVASHLPLTGENSGSGYQIEDHPQEENAPPPIFMHRYISAGWLEAMGVRLLEGRLFTAEDQRDRSGGVIISRSLAERYWPGGSALGKRIRPGRGETLPWNTVIGVIEDIKIASLDERDPADQVHLPLLAPLSLPPAEGAAASAAAEPPNDIEGRLVFVVRTRTEPNALVPALRAELAALDADLPMVQVMTLEKLVRNSRARVSFTVVVLLIASALALTLAVIGLYGVISFVVAKRTREIGLRLALGAQRADVVRQVLRGGVLMALAGIALGLLLAFGTTRFIEGQLYGITKYDLPTFVVVPSALFMVALLASWIPAVRAARVQPIEALRQE